MAKRTRLLTLCLSAMALSGILNLGACANRQAPQEAAAPLDLQSGFRVDFPSPGQLGSPHGTAYTLADLGRSGAEFDVALPNNLVTATPPNLDFAATGGSNLSDMAYAVYAFPLAGYDRDSSITYTWATPPSDFNNVYVGLSNWEMNAWEWRVTSAVGTWFLADMGPYIGAEPEGYCYVAMVFTNGETGSLSSLQIGTNWPDDTLRVVPEVLVADPGDIVRVSVWCTGSLHKLNSLEALRVVLPQYNSYVPGSLNAGAPGGTTNFADGAWSTIGIANVGLPPDAAITPVDLGGGLIAYDFYVKPNGGMDIDEASGELFNFQIQVYTDVDFSFQRNDGSTDRTYYKDLAGSTYYWTYDDNAGGQGIALSGNALPVADIQADAQLVNIPATVNFDASASSDTFPGSIVKYEFDYGDGAGFEDNGANPLASHEYSVKGKYDATVRVTDNEGGQSSASVVVYASYYDEVEPNDSRATGNNIPVLPISNFHGSVGDSTFFVVYDGSILDYFNFSPNPGDVIGINCSFPEGQVDLQMELRDKDGQFLAQSAKDGKSPQSIVYNVGANVTPLNLMVFASTGAGDYTLDITLNPPVADLSANPMVGDPPLLVDFDASGSYDIMPGSIVKYEFDFGEGGGWEDYGAATTAQHTYNADGSYQVKLRVTDNDGLFDTDMRTIQVGNPYDETEDNDDYAQANAVSFPMSNWAGSLGASPPLYQGYDGDDRDYVKFTATAGQTISFDISGDSDTADIDIHLEDINGNILAESTSPEAVESFEYTFTADGEYYIYIELWYATVQDGFSDYLCNGTLL